MKEQVRSDLAPHTNWLQVLAAPVPEALPPDHHQQRVQVLPPSLHHQQQHTEALQPSQGDQREEILNALVYKEKISFSFFWS